EGEDRVHRAEERGGERGSARDRGAGDEHDADTIRGLCGGHTRNSGLSALLLKITCRENAHTPSTLRNENTYAPSCCPRRSSAGSTATNEEATAAVAVRPSSARRMISSATRWRSA